MSLLQVNLGSAQLNHTVTLHAIIPMNAKTPLRTLYLLHGMYGNYTDWLYNTRILLWAQEHNIAVIMPSAENSYYVDQPQKMSNYAKFVGEELIEMTRYLFPLSTKKEDTYIGGLSMGGYGAMKLGLSYPETFSKIAALSSAFITDDLDALTQKSEAFSPRRDFFASTFGDLTKVKGSLNDPKRLILDLQKANTPLPEMYLACGTEDFLINENRDFHNFLTKEKVAHTYLESTGDHNWAFWDEYIEKVLIWLNK